MRGIIDRLGAVRLPLVAAAVLTLSIASASAQVVEQPQTWDNLNEQWPCNNGLTNRIARVMDADSTSDIGGGGGSTQVWVQCDGVDTWSIVNIGGGGGGGGVTGLTSCADGTALADNALLRADGTTKCQGSTVTVADSTGNLQWEGATADAFEGNFTFADPTADWTWAWDATGNVTIPGNIQGPAAGFTIFGGTSTTADLTFQVTTGNGTTGSDMHFLVGNNGALEALRLMPDGQSVFRTVNIGSSDGTDTDAKISMDQGKFYIGSGVEISWGSTVTPAGYGYAPDTEIGREAADVVKIDSLIELTPIASGGTCDAGNEGRIYNDSSHALCWCDGTTVQKLSGGGTCD